MVKPPRKTKADDLAVPTPPEAGSEFANLFHDRLNYLFDVNQVPPNGQGRTTWLNQFLPNVSKSTARRLAAGEGYPSLETFAELQRKFGVSSDWLIHGTGSPFLGGQVTNQIPAQWEIVLLAKRSTSESGEIEVSMLPSTNNSIIIVRAEGDAMEPSISDGDRVIVETSITEMVDGKIYLLETAKGNVFRRVEKSLGSGWRLVPSNEKYRPETVSSVSLVPTTRGIRIVGAALANIFSVLR